MTINWTRQPAGPCSGRKTLSSLINGNIAMKALFGPPRYTVLLGISLLASSVHADGAECQQQAAQIIQRLQAEVVGPWSVTQVASAQQIVLDVCQEREKQLDLQTEQAVEQARKEEQAQANSWFTESADKAGNKRLKRKGH
jgi:hypothetical protein